jgi:hypothetical protein
MKRYQPSNIAPTQGKQLLAISSVVAGIAIGGVAGFVSQWFYLIILFPIVMGGASAAAIAWAVKKGKVRNPLIAAAFAALSGLVLYGTMNYVQYLLFMQQQIKEAQTYLPNSDRATINQFIDTALQSQTGSSGVVGYIKLSAQNGITITKAGRSSKSGIHLDETLTWIYWAIELAVIEGLAIASAFAAASAPFSEDANDWYDGMQFVGVVETSLREELLTHINNEHFGRVGGLVDVRDDVAHPRLEIFTQSCAASSSSDSVFFLYSVTKNKKDELDKKELKSGLITPLQTVDLLRAIEEKRAEQNLATEQKEENSDEQNQQS